MAILITISILSQLSGLLGRRLRVLFRRFLAYVLLAPCAIPTRWFLSAVVLPQTATLLCLSTVTFLGMFLTFPPSIILVVFPCAVFIWSVIVFDFSARGRLLLVLRTGFSGSPAAAPATRSRRAALLAVSRSVVSISKGLARRASLRRGCTWMRLRIYSPYVAAADAFAIVAIVRSAPRWGIWELRPPKLAHAPAMPPAGLNLRYHNSKNWDTVGWVGGISWAS